MASIAPYDELRSRFKERTFTDLDIFRHCIGLRSVSSVTGNFPQLSTIAQQLAKNTLLATIDCEHYTVNSFEMTEIGVCIMKTEDAAQISQAGDFGDHGENLMNVAQYHHLRLIEKSHLLTTNVSSRGPEGNRFGGSRFVTFNEARQILHGIMARPITGAKGLEGFMHPVVLMGHGLQNDHAHFNGKDLGFDVDSLRTVIREIDTQKIAVNRKYWHNKIDPIGLGLLISKLDFQHRDAHTALNDAARTFMCAVIMAIPNSARELRNRSVQEVANVIERNSQQEYVPLGGVEKYCSKCGSKTHMRKDCDQRDRISCAECASRGLDFLSTTHIALHCPIVRDEVVAERQRWYDDQKGYSPKHPYDSSNRLQAYGQNAPTAQPAEAEEVAERRQFYNRRQTNNKGRLVAFEWSGRSFAKSDEARSGPPVGSKPTKN